MKMKSRFSSRFIWFFTSVWLLASLGNAIAAGAKGTATAGVDSRSPVPDPLVLVQYTEAMEKAFSLLIPKGWITEGGIFYVDPNTAGGSANSTAPKVNFSVKSDDAGTIMLQWLPDYYYCDMRFSPAGQMGLFPPGSRYNGMLVTACPQAKDFLLQIAFPQVRARAQNLQIVEVKPMPQVAQQFATAAPVPGFQYDAAMVTVTYLENGVKIQEQMFTVIENMGQAGAGLWQNKQTVFARAPAEEFKAWEKVGSMIYYSVKINPQWLSAVIQASNQRSQTALNTQKYIQQLDADIVAHRQKVNAEMRHNGYLTLTGQEDYINPYTGETEIRPDGWKHHWQNSGGEVIVSNDGNYDPNQDMNLKRTDFKKSTVRAR
jgi:hypothetical protein